MIFNFYFILFFKILTLNAQKMAFLGKSLKNSEKRGGTDKMAFWAFKSQNFENVYKIKIKNHAILHMIQ